MLPRRPRRVDRFHRRGRAAVATGIALWLLSQVAVAWSHPRWRDPVYHDKKAKLDAFVAARPGSPLVVAFGSSRVTNGFRGQEMAGVAAFNFAVPATGPVASLVHIRRLLASGPRPELVVVELMPAMSAKSVWPMESRFQRPERLSSDEVQTLIDHGFPAKPTRERHTYAARVPIHGHRFPMLGRLFPEWLPFGLRESVGRGGDESGWAGPANENITEEERRDAVEGVRTMYGAVLDKLEFDGPIARAISDAIADCRAAGVPVVVLLMPEGSECRALYSPTALARIEAFTRGLPAPVVDAREWLPDDAFLDSHHMKSAGATVFSRRLAVELRGILKHDAAAR